MDVKIKKLINEYLKLGYPIKRVNLNENRKVGRSYFVKAIRLNGRIYPLNGIEQFALIEMLSKNISIVFRINKDLSKEKVINYLKIKP